MTFLELTIKVGHLRVKATVYWVSLSTVCMVYLYWILKWVGGSMRNKVEQQFETLNAQWKAIEGFWVED